ncbi:MAG TPA: GDP-mannose 4,6-dehydratase, partial [bacterium]|nr:GDP-mannose 4,6-dehydratase [bacterium]
YAATKKSNELQASTYARLYDIPMTGLRFFTVYGPKGRPDMSIRMFMEGLDRGEPIPMFGDGSFERDFTYVDDIIDGVVKALKVARGKKGWDHVFNLGEFRTTTVRRMILFIVESLGRWKCDTSAEQLSEQQVQEAIDSLVNSGLVVRLPVPLGDVPKTCADISKAREILGYDPKTPLAEGIRKTARWHLEQGSSRQDPLRQAFHKAIREYWKIRNRASLDSLGRPKEPVYTESDLGVLLHCLDQFEKAAQISNSRCEKMLATRLIAWSWEVVGWIASSLSRDGEPKSAGLGRLTVHRKRMRLVQLLRDSGHDPLHDERLDTAMSLSREIINLTGERERAIVVAAAGYGSRVAKDLGGLNKKHSLFLGDEMLLLSLRNVIPFARRIIVVANERNVSEIQERLERSEINESNGFQIEYVIQENRFGDGEAHLTAWKALRDFNGVALFVFADAPTKTPETIERMLILKEALGPLVPLVVPCEDDDNPYSPIMLASDGLDRGRVLWNWQKADEQDFPEAALARKTYGLRNVGLFAAETCVFPFMEEFRDEVFSEYPRFRKWQQAMKQWQQKGSPESGKPKEPEYGFADLMKVLPRRGIEVAAPNLATRADRLNVNSLEDAETVKRVFLERNPLARVEVERRPDSSEIYVRMIDLDPKGNPIIYQGVPSLRHCTRFRFARGTRLDEAKVEKQIGQHIEHISKRIYEELGIKVVCDTHNA